ncbi:DUF3658 domain-containing protein [Steroidobacter sp.]|uniref:DUF3658 domain-containing protein n=1 Tax=Steroidobacter sp. TaxID=1978227 RepID=UPI001A4A4533|nr:DUF3658 domain-containing protein [Steroidobacter sp.]MBL8264719.1 hypothetical protein [Steroidobacter sp.]
MDEMPIPNPPLSADEAALVAKLSAKELDRIDATVLECTYEQFRKVAMVVSLCIEKLGTSYPNFSDVFYAERVRALVEAGKLESQGNVSYMRFSEVRRSQ